MKRELNYGDAKRRIREVIKRKYGKIPVFCSKTGINNTQLYGDNSFFSVYTLCIIADALEISVDYILFGKDNSK